MSQGDFIYEMKVRGYSVFANVLDGTILSRIERALCALPSEAAYKGTILDLFGKLPIDCIRAMIENEVILRGLDRLLGNTHIVHSFNSSPLRPGAKAPTSSFHRDSGRYIPNYDYAFNVLYSITDFTSSSGVFKILPGSHIVEEKPSDAWIAANTLAIEIPAGSAVLFNSNLWHASGENKSDRSRWGVGLTYRRSYMRQQFDFPRAVSSEIVEQLSERGRQLLGFDVRMPTTLEEFSLPESERLYRAGQG